MAEFNVHAWDTTPPDAMLSDAWLPDSGVSDDGCSALAHVAAHVAQTESTIDAVDGFNFELDLERV